MNDLVVNPYVIQMDKFVASLKKLSEVFLDMEENPLFFSEEKVRQVCDRVLEKTCGECGNEEECLVGNRHLLYALLRDIFQAVEDCGTELSVEVKRKTQKNCMQAPRFLRHAVDAYREEKQRLLWNQKIALNREGCANQLDSFARTIQHATRELDASIFADEYLDKKIRQRCTQLGLKVLTTIFFVTEEGRYEIHVTARAMKGQCVSCKELADAISQSCGRTMILGKEERTVVGQEYSTITCVEGPRFHTLCGVARVGKSRQRISGDSFSMLALPGGKQGVILSDGMGAGEAAYRESSMVVELLEELLEAGFPKKTALQMMNTVLVTGREDVRFSTIDMASFDLYSGKCELLKAGAATTYIRHGSELRRICSSSLPLGVVSDIQLDEAVCELEDGDLVIMVTDGVLDALPVGEQDVLMEMMIEGITKTNPKEFAQRLLEQILACSGEVPTDDMTVLTVGIWSLEK